MTLVEAAQSLIPSSLFIVMQGALSRAIRQFTQVGVSAANPSTRRPTLGFGISRLTPTCMEAICRARTTRHYRPARNARRTAIPTGTEWRVVRALRRITMFCEAGEY